MYIDNKLKKKKKERHLYLFKLFKDLCFIVVCKHVHTKPFLQIFFEK